MSKKRVLLTRKLPGIASEILHQRYHVDAMPENEPYPTPLLQDAVREYDAILATISEQFDREILGSGGRLKVISNFAIGLDNIDVQHAAALGIQVCNTPDAVTESTADLTLGLLLSHSRHINQADTYVRNSKWTKWDPYLFLGEEMSGQCLGSLGFGRCGQAVAKRALGFGMTVRFYDRTTRNTKLSEVGDIDFVEYPELLRISDVLTIHLPLTPQTKGLIGNESFLKMSRTPLVLNMARGDIVDTDALIQALERKRIRGAILDVVSGEPISGEHPLCRFSNVLLSPHIGTATIKARRKMASAAAKNIINALG